MGRGNKGSRRHKQNQRSRNSTKSPLNQQQNKTQQSSLSTTVFLRPLATEKSRIVTDTDWEELEGNVNKLDDFNKEYSEWSRSCYSIAVSFIIFFITLIIEHKSECIKLWYFYLFGVIALIALLVGVYLMTLGMTEKQKVKSTKTNIVNVIQRIEKKSSEINFDYNQSKESFSL